MIYLSRRFHNSAYLLIFELLVLNQNQAYHIANLLGVRFKDNLELAHFVRINDLPPIDHDDNGADDSDILGAPSDLEGDEDEDDGGGPPPSQRHRQLVELASKAPG